MSLFYSFCGQGVLGRTHIYIIYIYGICLEDAWIVYGMCTNYAWNMRGVCMEYSWNMHGICIAYAWYMHCKILRYRWGVMRTATVFWYFRKWSSRSYHSGVIRCGSEPPRQTRRGSQPRWLHYIPRLKALHNTGIQTGVHVCIALVLFCIDCKHHFQRMSAANTTRAMISNIIFKGCLQRLLRGLSTCINISNNLWRSIPLPHLV